MYVKFEVDGRAYLQRMMNALLYYHGWTNVYLCDIIMPRRGTLEAGSLKMADTMDVDFDSILHSGGCALSMILSHSLRAVLALSEAIVRSSSLTFMALAVMEDNDDGRSHPLWRNVMAMLS